MQDILASRKIKTYRLGLGQFNFFYYEKTFMFYGSYGGNNINGSNIR